MSSNPLGPDNGEPDFFNFDRSNYNPEDTSVSTPTPPGGIDPDELHQAALDQELLEERRRRDLKVALIAVASTAMLIAIVEGGFLILNQVDRQGRITANPQFTPTLFINPSATFAAAATLPATPTQWLPPEWQGAEPAPSAEADPTLEAPSQEAAPAEASPEPPVATEQSAPFFEQFGISGEDYLEHAQPFAGTIRQLTEREDRALREQILPFLPAFVREDNVTDPETNEGTVTYRYSVSPNDTIALREDEALADVDTQIRLVRFNLQTGEFDLVRQSFQATEVKRLLAPSRWEFRFTPNELRNNDGENPYDYLYIALQHLDLDSIQFSEEDTEGVDQDRLRALLERTIGIEPFRLVPFFTVQVSPTPTAMPSATTGATQQPGGGGGGTQPNATATARPTDIPVPTNRPTDIPVPTVRPTDIPVPLVAEGAYTFNDQTFYRIKVDQIPAVLLPLFEDYEAINGEIHISEEDLIDLGAQLGY